MIINNENERLDPVYVTHERNLIRGEFPTCQAWIHAHEFNSMSLLLYSMELLFCAITHIIMLVINVGQSVVYVREHIVRLSLGERSYVDVEKY